MRETKLGPGFRFRPTDVELVRYYLRRKVLGKKLLTNDTIVEIDIYKYHPADLADKSCGKSGDLKWYFFCPREKKYSTGDRTKRSTESGYWKASGKDRDVSYNNQVVGRIRTLVFHSGKKCYGERTDWIIHEYKLEDKELEQNNVPQDTYVLCILFKKNGVGPRHGDEYGAPYKEEDWSDHEEKDTENLVTIPSSENNDPGPSKRSCVLDVPALTETMHPPDNVAHTPMFSPHFEVAPLDDTDLYAMDQFFESFIVDGFDNPNEVKTDEPCVAFDEEALICLDDVDFNGIADFNFNDDLFIELQDLIEPVITAPPPPPDPAQAGDDLRSNGQT